MSSRFHTPTKLSKIQLLGKLTTTIVTNSSPLDFAVDFPASPLDSVLESLEMLVSVEMPREIS